MTIRRGGGPRLMEKTILNFHFDYLTTPLKREPDYTRDDHHLHQQEEEPTPHLWHQDDRHLTHSLPAGSFSSGGTSHCHGRKRKRMRSKWRSRRRTHILQQKKKVKQIKEETSWMLQMDPSPKIIGNVFWCFHMLFVLYLLYSSSMFACLLWLVISTEVALRLPTTYDNQPNSIHPHIALKTTSHDWLI